MERHFDLYKVPKSTGKASKKHRASNLDQYIVFAEQSGRELLDVLAETGYNPKDSEPFTYLLHYFEDMSCGRSYHMSGPLPLSHQEILAWKQLFAMELSKLELEVLRVIDNVYLKVALEDGG